MGYSCWLVPVWSILGIYTHNGVNDMSNYKIDRGLLNDVTDPNGETFGSTYQDGRKIIFEDSTSFTPEELIEIAYAMKAYQRIRDLEVADHGA
jgi:hypothetical protein